MPRYRDPERDMLDEEKVLQGSQRIALDTAKFYQSGQQHIDTMSMDQQKILLAKKQLIFQLTKDRIENKQKDDALTNGIELYKRLGAIDNKDPGATDKVAAALAEHAAGVPFAKDFINKKMSGINEQARLSSEAFSPLNVSRGMNDLQATLKTLNSLAAKEGQDPSVKNSAMNVSKYLEAVSQQALTTLPAGKSNLQPAAPTATPAPAPGFLDRVKNVFSPAAATPAPSATLVPSATPTAIATDNATKFMQSIGIGAPQAAAQSGLPDAAEQSLTPETDDEIA